MYLLPARRLPISEWCPPVPPQQQMRRVAVALLSTASTAALPCADPYAVPQPCRTYGLRVPASCVPYVPEAQGSWCATVRTPHAYRTYRVPCGEHRPCVRSTCTRTRDTPTCTVRTVWHHRHSP
eukprot:scaffold32887_cov35-Phaeocystis_antarctica.AAC.1